MPTLDNPNPKPRYKPFDLKKLSKHHQKLKTRNGGSNSQNLILFSYPKYASNLGIKPAASSLTLDNQSHPEKDLVQLKPTYKTNNPSKTSIGFHASSTPPTLPKAKKNSPSHSKKDFLSKNALISKTNAYI